MIPYLLQISQQNYTFLQEKTDFRNSLPNFFPQVFLASTIKKSKRYISPFGAKFQKDSVLLFAKKQKN